MAWRNASPRPRWPVLRQGSTMASRSTLAGASWPMRCSAPQRWRFEMSIAAPEPKANMGQPIPRYDAVAKVTGKAQYAADVALGRPVYAYLVTSSIAKGRIDGFDLADARKVRGVIDIVTHENAEKLKEAKLFSNGGYTSSTIQPLRSADIAQDGEIVAVTTSRTSSWSISTTRRTRTCSPGTIAPSAMAACACRTRISTPPF